MDEKEKIVKKFLSELENKESVNTLFSANVMSRIKEAKEEKTKRRALIKYWSAIISAVVAFVLMVYLVIFVLFDVNIPFKVEKFVNIWQNGSYTWGLIGINAFILLILQQLLSKKLERYNETNSMSSSENSRLKA